jgi:hypothetical protein
MSLPFDDFSQFATTNWPSGQPSGVDTPRMMELEAAGPGAVNRLAIVTGHAWLSGNPDADYGNAWFNPGDGMITITTGYRLTAHDRFEGLVDDDAALKHSTYVSLANVQSTGNGDFNAWIDGVDVDMLLDETDHRFRVLVLTIRANIDGDLAFVKLSYSVLLMFNSARPPALDFGDVVAQG